MSNSPKDLKITLDLNECPHVKTLTHWASVSRTLRNALFVLESENPNEDRLNLALDELKDLVEPLDWLHKATVEQITILNNK